jgi:pyruvate kinase
MEEGVVVHDGDQLLSTAEDPWTAKKVFMKYQNFPNDVNPGERILLDDGKLIF